MLRNPLRLVLLGALAACSGKEAADLAPGGNATGNGGSGGITGQTAGSNGGTGDSSGGGSGTTAGGASTASTTTSGTSATGSATGSTDTSGSGNTSATGTSGATATGSTTATATATSGSSATTGSATSTTTGSPTSGASATGSASTGSSGARSTTTGGIRDGGTTGSGSSSTGSASSSTGRDAGGTTAVDASLGSGDPCRGTALPVGQHYVPAGLCARAVATGQGELRQITFTSNGDLWGVVAGGQIKRFRDANGDGIYQASEIVNWATTGGNGNNVHIDEAGGYLYAGTSAGVHRWAWSNTINAGGTGEDVVTGQPSTGGHPKHTVHVWGGFMYVHSGSSDNVAAPSSPSALGYDQARSLIRRFDLSTFTGTALTWMSGTVFTDGLRNVVGFNADSAGRIYAVQNGQDDVTYGGTDVHNNNPGELIARIDMGLHHGYPFCFVAQNVNALASGTVVHSEIFPGNTKDDAWCQNASNVTKPTTFVQAHSAPLDITFYTGPFGTLPDKWKNGAFVALHGSWDRSPATGYKVVWVPFNADGTSPLPTNNGTTTTFPYEVVLGGGTVAGGPNDSTWNWSGGEQNVRPVGVAVSPTDGALYISSDSQGYIYRVGIQK